MGQKYLVTIHGPYGFIEHGNGMAKRYGLVYINTTDDELLDLRRIPKDSLLLVQSDSFKWAVPETSRVRRKRVQL